MTSRLLQHVQEASQRKWTDTQIDALNDKQRLALSKYNPQLNKGSMPVELLALINDRGFAPADGVYAAQTLKTKKAKSLSHATFPEVVAGGGAVTVTNKEVTVSLVSGTQTLPNTPIPGEVGVEDNYENLDAVALLCSSIVCVKKSNWVENRAMEWANYFEVSASGMKLLAETLIPTFGESEEWQEMPVTTRQSVTGHVAVRFVRKILNKLSKIDYDYINTIIVVDVLRAVYKTRKGWMVSMNDKDQPLIPPEIYSKRAIKKTKEEKEMFKNYPAVFTYRGGFCPKIHQLVEPDFSRTTAAVAMNDKVGIWAGGNSSAISIIALMEGYASIMLDAAKEYVFLIAATLNCWKQGRKVDIFVSSVGAFTPMHACLSFWQNHCSQKEEFVSMVNLTATEWFQFILPGRNKLINNPKLEAFCRPAVRSDAVSLFYLSANHPKKTNKEDAEPDWDVCSYRSMPPEIATDYIGITNIYGPYYFTQDAAMSLVMQKKSVEVKAAPRSIYVYKFGSCRDFMGVISSFKEVSLYGADANLRLDEHKLQCIKTREEWYKLVFTSNVQMLRSPWKPVVRASNIANLLIFTKNRLATASNVWDDSEVSVYAGNVFPRQKKRDERFQLTAEDAADQEQSEEDEGSDDSDAGGNAFSVDADSDDDGGSASQSDDDDSEDGSNKVQFGSAPPTTTAVSPKMAVVSIPSNVPLLKKDEKVDGKSSDENEKKKVKPKKEEEEKGDAKGSGAKIININDLE